ncbi:MAG: hypothetical protein ACJ79S_07645 [Gemmatimonadaceae bacterium]
MTRTGPYTRLSVAVILIAGVAGVAACDSSTAPRAPGAVDAQVSADVAATAGEGVAADVASLLADETLAGVAAGAALSGARAATVAEAAGCPFDAATQYHLCSRTTERGLDLTRRYQFRDASGAPMESYDPERTAAIAFGRTLDGHLSGTTAAGVSWTAATHQSAERIVSGLAGAETQRVWNGSGSSADTTTHSDGATTRHYAATTAHLARNVVVKLPRSSFPWPQSGTMTRTVSADLEVVGARDGTRRVSRTVTVTFNGTARVPLVVNDLSCTLDLETGRVSDCGR